MIGVFLKELRENLKWAAVIFGVLLVMFWHEMRQPTTFLVFQLAERYTVWVAPVAGLLMGIVQTLFETRPDNWAFVVHRPIRRSHIFIAKCAAGLLLLYASLILPCLFASAWAARPGHLPAPYQWRMSLPLVADVFNAGCYYFLGMVLTLRRARWYGTRILPLGWALGGSVAVSMFTQYFWQAAVVIVIVQCIGAMAAWGAFEANGSTVDAAPATRFALGAMIFPGALAVGMFLAGLTELFYAGGRWQYYQIDQEGNVVRVTQTIERGERAWNFTDISGQPLAKYANIDLDDPANANVFIRYGAFLVDENKVPWPLNVQFLNHWYRAPAPIAVRLNAVAPQGVRLRYTAFYNVREHHIDLFDPVTSSMIGTVGPDGFTAGGSTTTAGRFPGTPLSLAAQGGMHVLPFESVVYWIELDHRRVRPVFTATADDPVFSAREVGPATDPTVVIATRRRLHLLRPSGETIFSIDLPVDPEKYFIQPALLPTNHHLVLDLGTFPGAKDVRRTITEYAADGSVVRSTNPPRLHDARSPKRPETAGFGAVFPLALRPVIPTWALDEVIDIRSEEFAGMFEGFMLGSAIGCAGLSILIGRRCGFGARKTIGWSAANLLLGPAGVVVMLGLNDWPAYEACGVCGSQRRLTGRRDCNHCGVALPPPAFDGREIFEPADADADSVLLVS